MLSILFGCKKFTQYQGSYRPEALNCYSYLGTRKSPSTAVTEGATAITGIQYGADTHPRHGYTNCEHPITQVFARYLPAVDRRHGFACTYSDFQLTNEWQKDGRSQISNPSWPTDEGTDERHSVRFASMPKEECISCTRILEPGRRVE